ncbi:MAG: hypothetical protein RLZZ123_2693 [Pseudomonadota bacterium]|jgi:hypothetical protein
MITATDQAALAQRPAPIYLEGRLPFVVEASSARQLGLKDGQVIQANLDVQNNLWLMRFQDGKSLEIPREWAGMLRLATGDRLSFRVQFLANGSIFLRPVGAGPDPGATQGSPVAANLPSVSDTLAPRADQLLARPQTLKTLQDLFLPGVLAQMAAKGGEMPTALMQWLQAQPSMVNLTAQQVRQWMMQSGWFNEGQMGLGRMLAPDAKTALKSLLNSLKKAQDSGADLIEDALSDIESSQLSAVASGSGQDQAVSLMLSFQDAPAVRLKFAREGNSDASTSRPFVVDLELTLPELGAVWLRTRILRPSGLELMMWAERGDVAQLARQQAPNLRAQLHDAGLEVYSMQILHGVMPKAEPAVAHFEGPGHLVDIKT